MTAAPKTSSSPAASPDRNAGPALPRHVAIIMDGNRRWAKARGLPKTMGHRAGVEAVRRTVRAAGDMGLPVLTLYSFSSENWKRPPDEVHHLMGLLRLYVESELNELVRNNVRVRIIGDRHGLRPDIAALLERSERATAANTGLQLQIAFNYGGRDELVRAVRGLARLAAEGRLAPDDITAETVSSALDTGGVPDPDLVIRTSGEQRLSNFLIWQAAYAEFVFQDILWPDYDGAHLRAAINVYQARERRFGGRPDEADSAERARP